jgi:tRNA 2-thiouridine synthesizing protein E
MRGGIRVESTRNPRGIDAESMKTVAIEGRPVQVDDEGYLVDPAAWTRAVAEEFARQEGIELTDDHWAVIGFMRSYLDEHQVAADARFVIRFLAEQMGKGADARVLLFRLFPYGYVRQACRIAGMRRPRAWSTG